MPMRRLLLLTALLALAWSCPAPVAASPAAASPDVRARAAVQAFLKAYEAVRTFQGRIRSETRLGPKVDVTRSALWLEKPNATVFEVLASTATPSSVGTRLIWHGEPKCEVKTRFFGFPVKLTPAFDDPRLAGIRGWNLREISIGSVVRLMDDPRSTFRYVGSDTVLGRPMTVIEARGPQVLRGTDREVAYFDNALRLPFALEAWSGDERALRVEIEAFVFDAPLPAETYKLD